jgi:hypothetical protein
LEFDGSVIVPNAARTAKIGNARLGRDAGAGEDDGAPGTFEEAPERIDG